MEALIVLNTLMLLATALLFVGSINKYAQAARWQAEAAEQRRRLAMRSKLRG